MMSNMAITGIFGGFFAAIISIAMLVLSIYVLILSIRFLKKGTEAFEVYIESNKNNRGNF